LYNNKLRGIFAQRLVKEAEEQDESESVGETDLRKMQNHQASRQGDGHLREPEAQADAGL